MKKTIFTVLALSIFNFSAIANEKLNIVTTIKPINSLVQSVLGDTATTNLLVQNTSSPHGYQLKPSQIILLQNADIIFYIDDSFERFLEKPFKNLKNTKKIALSEAQNIKLLPYRKNGAWEEDKHNEHNNHDEHQSHKHKHKHKHKEEFDMHIWLSPTNAIAILNEIERKLSELNPSQKNIYKQNAAKMTVQIKQTDKKIKRQLQEIKTKPYIVFHDAYQYFEESYGLNAVGSITLEPGQSLSATRIKEIQNKIKSTKAVCIFKEPQFSDKYVNALQTENTNLKISELDPLGSNIKYSSQLYIDVLKNISLNLQNCLK